DAVHLTDGAPQFHRRAVGVPLERQAAHLVEQRLPPRVGRRIRRLVGVQPYGDVDLRRVVALEVVEVVTELHFFFCPRRRTDSAWAGRPSASARAATAGATRANAPSPRLTTWIHFTKSSTRRALLNRAVPNVGSTWLGPAT